MFGDGVHTLVDTARKEKPLSLAAKASSTNPVYTYTAPEESGSSRVSIYLHGSAAMWTPKDADEKLTPYRGKPDAIIALNAGLGAYNTWHPLVVWAHATETPFAVTEYAEQSCEVCRDIFPMAIAQQCMRGDVCTGPGAPTQEQCDKMTKRKRDYPIALNPFHRPGQREVPTKLPDLVNGFTQLIVSKD